MEKVFPILPCPDIRTQTAFYEHLGFQIKQIYTSPNPYAVVQLHLVELHFYGTRRMTPAENASMCYIRVQDVDAICQAFTTALKKSTGKVPRSGIPRISKVRDLVDDRRFTLTDPAGNTFFIGALHQGKNDNFFRTLKNETWAKKFAVLYDLVYSKEDLSMVTDMLPRFDAAMNSLEDLDKARLILVSLEIQKQLGKPMNDANLKALLLAHDTRNGDWTRVSEKHNALLQEDI